MSSGSQTSDSTIARPHTDAEGFVGPYRILEQLGVGGMGAVFKAEQRVPVKRIVAVKRIKPGFDTSAVIARFESERQALARMDHPHIAKVLDAGSDKYGRPYFVMEYVPGVPIVEFADKNRLSIAQRLELFLQVCEAIAHAHTKALIHRDIKSANVLAYMSDGRPFVKVIDFGVAKALSGEKLTDRTLNTQVGGVIGTYGYMSPEQAAGSADIDTRTDVYSLGVLLYELLAGALPFDKAVLQRAAEDEIKRIICEEPPPRPSTRISSLGDAADTVAKARQMTAHALRQELNSELDWIPLMALRKERERRYVGATDLAADIRNYLEHRPLRARPDSLQYRVRKYLRRNRVFVTGVAAVVLALLLGVFGTTAGFFQARRQAAEAELQRAAAEEQRGKAQKAEATAIFEMERAQRSDYASSMALASTMAGKLGSIRSILRNAPPQLRNWEWGYLWRSTDDSLMTLRGHKDSVLSVAYSPDGTRIATGATSDDKTVILWDAATGRRLNTLTGHDKAITYIVFSTDGSRIVTSSRDSTVRIWDSQTARELHTLRGHNDQVLRVAIRSDGRRVASLGYDKDNTLRIWDVETGRQISSHHIDSEQWLDAMFRPGQDGPVAIVRYETAKLKSIDVETGRVLCDMTDSGAWISWARFSPDGSRIVSSPNNGTVSVWDATTGRKLQILAATASAGNSTLAFHPDDRTVAIGTTADTLCICDSRTGEVLNTLRGHGGQILCSAFSPDGKRVASGGKDRTAKVWNVQPRPQPLVVPGDAGPINAVAFSADGRRVVTGGGDGSLRLWDADTGSSVAVAHPHGAALNAFAFDHEGKRIVSAGGDKTLAICDWDGQHLTVTKLPWTPDNPVRSVAFSPDGKLVALAELSKVSVVDVSQSREIFARVSEYYGQLTSAAFTADGKHVITGSENARLKFWDSATGKDEATMLSHNAPVFAFAVSHDGRRIASASADKTLKTWDVKSKKELATLSGHEGPVTSVSFSADDKRVVSGSADATVRVWDAETGRELLTLLGHKGAVKAVAFAPDGKRIASGGADATLRIWDADTGRPWAETGDGPLSEQADIH